MKISWWDQYRKTFIGMQLVIAIVTLGAYLLLGRAMQAAVFFLVMQVSAFIGSVWAVRIKMLASPRAVALPLRPVD